MTAPEDFNEERLTAYALGELSESERLDVERTLAASEAARAALAEIRETAALLERELGQEPCPAMTEAQEQAVLERAAGNGRGRMAWRWPVAGMALAASLAVVAGSSFLLWRTLAPEQKMYFMMAAEDKESGDTPVEADLSELEEQLEALGYMGEGESLQYEDMVSTANGPADGGPVSGRESERGRATIMSGVEEGHKRLLASEVSDGAEPAAMPGGKPADDRYGVDADGDGEVQTIVMQRTGLNVKLDVKTDESGLLVLDTPDGRSGDAPVMSAEDAERLSVARASARGNGVDLNATGGGLQNVQVGGELRIRGQYYSEFGRIPADRREHHAVRDAKKAGDIEVYQAYVEPGTGAAPEGGGYGGGAAGAGRYGGGGGYGGGGYGGGGRLKGPVVASGEALAQDDAYTSGVPVIGELLRSEEERETPQGGVISTNGRFEEARRGEEISMRSRSEPTNAEEYDALVDNPFLAAAQHPVSTFSVDVDTASYANVRRYLTAGQLPPKNAVRIEEMINYFSYQYAPPTGLTEEESKAVWHSGYIGEKKPDDAASAQSGQVAAINTGSHPFSAHVEVTGCPWESEHRLVRIGLKGKEISQEERKPCNFVFLLDVSGSMKDDDKLPLLKRAMALLVESLTKDDRVAIVTFRNEAGLHLSPTTCDQKQVVLAAIDELQANGGTNGGAGLELAYDLATEHLVEDGNNRVLVGTDGDFNVGVTSRPELVQLIEDRAKKGIFLTVMGFGEGNLQDSDLEALADKGNGIYCYIDTFNEARRVLCEDLAGTVFTIAKDVKIQIEFNPSQVAAYRLIGYANRLLAARDFNDDRKDAGDIGAGHTVTALYEVVPVGVAGPLPGVDNLRYQKPPAPPENLTGSEDLFWLKLRSKMPDSDTSELLELGVADQGAGLDAASPDTKFAAAVAAFGMVLRDSDARGDADYDLVLDLARQAKDPDPDGYRAEFINLVETAKTIAAR